MSIEDDLPQLDDLLAERYPYTIKVLSTDLNDLADLIAAGNRLANLLASQIDDRAPDGPTAAAVMQWDQARDRFPEIDP